MGIVNFAMPMSEVVDLVVLDDVAFVSVVAFDLVVFEVLAMVVAVAWFENADMNVVGQMIAMMTSL